MFLKGIGCTSYPLFGQKKYNENEKGQYDPKHFFKVYKKACKINQSITKLEIDIHKIIDLASYIKISSVIITILEI